MTLQRREPQDPTSPERPTTVKGPFDAFRKALAANPKLAPENETIPAFIDWLRANGYTGVHMQKDLWAEYIDICRMAGFKPTKEKWLGRELRKAGYEPFQADKRRRGKGPRRMAVDLTVKNEVAAIIANNVIPLPEQKTTAAITAIDDNVVDLAA
jgi:hypothetical protein